MTTRSTELLRVAHQHPGVTRADAARRLGIGTGAATELVARLSQAALLAEAPATPSGARGRPTTVLVPHPSGPLVLAAEITHEAWRIDVVELGGHTLTTVASPHAGTPWPEVTAAVAQILHTYGGRVRGMGVSVPGTVAPALRLDASTAGWHDVDLTTLWPGALTRVPAAAVPSSGAPALSVADASTWPTPTVFVAGNDASFAAAAESARGAATDAAVALHIRIESGLGGAIVDQGHLLLGATGASGEFGHMPFGDPAILCPCGARGCWGTAVDGTALARFLGQPPPPDPVTYARRVIASPGPHERAAVGAVAAALGRGIAGLVNGVDADLVTLGSIAADLLAAAPAELHTSYRSGLMAIRRASPPPLVAAALGSDGPIAGAAEKAWSALFPQLP
ncbi:ROK family protein [Paractinoplanes brasiliensis]|uniref:Putative NBD/HSP70 family sugar kinase n=1 Tax=Paractinoplanes brasiliensis TaxID=52695 RepID=A0A4R6JVN8_9ACTN|nr:ROK family protein [Actinoplanes brasiliensis]TDO39912.1 putative NBD/HSP70 family sugar kinase [Actinoplanes brasiliensis]GID31532.1 xylose repressor [Actinoplanes brasiliensis]